MGDMGCPDKPVASISEDLFNVSTYINGLCSFVRSCDTPMTISIQGDWGSGKTSMMNMMRENLQASIWPIWFNTWQFSQFDMGNSLAFSMMDVLMKGLDCDQAVIKKVLGGIAGFTKNAVRVVTDQAAGGTASELAANIMNSGISSDYASEVLQLKEKFQDAVDKKLTKEHRDRVVIFVDDLDRLRPVKAVELLEVLKLFLDCEKCVFILAVDYEVVTLGIREKFGGSVSEEKGRSFFDKIIQLPFKVPVAQYDIQRYVRDMMDKMSIWTEQQEILLFTNLIRTSIGFNPRSMKRLFNTYQLLDIITKNTVNNMDEAVRKRILFASVCVQMNFDEFYFYLTSTQIDTDTFGALIKTEERENVLQEIYADVKKDNLEQKIKKLSSFIPYFVQSLKTDDSEELSEKELQNLRVILKCSVITSVNAGNQNDTSDLVWNYRDANKQLAKKTASLLAEIGDFAIWLPRKEREGIHLYDVSGYFTWILDAGFRCTLEYYLSRIDGSSICVHIYVSLADKGNEQAFFKLLGDDPLNLGKKPVKVDWGRYKYLNVLSFHDNDSCSAEQIAEAVKNAYAAINEIGKI